MSSVGAGSGIAEFRRCHGCLHVTGARRGVPMCLVEDFHVCRIHGAQQRGQCKMPPSTSWRPCLRGRTTRITAYPARGTSSSGTLGRARDGSSVRLTSRSSCRVELLPEVSMAAEPESGLDTRGPCSRRGAVRPPAPSCGTPYFPSRDERGTNHLAILCGAL